MNYKPEGKCGVRYKAIKTKKENLSKDKSLSSGKQKRWESKKKTWNEPYSYRQCAESDKQFTNIQPICRLVRRVSLLIMDSVASCLLELLFHSQKLS